MTPALTDIFTSAVWFQTAALLLGVIFFLIVGLRELRHGHAEGYLYLTLAVFFSVAHAIVLSNGLENNMFHDLPRLNLWTWLTSQLAPALIALYVLRAAASFCFASRHEGLTRLFFGLTLVCFLYMVGAGWPVDIRAIIALLWLGILFKTELVETD